MSRPLRIEFDGAWYHVMNRGAGKRPIFPTHRSKRIFLGLLQEISTVYGVEIHAYCLMDNHYHLFVHTPVAGLSRPMRHLNGVYTQRHNRVQDTDGPLFRGRYKTVLVSAETHFCCVSRYIHMNPVSAGIVSRPEDYRDSSYRAFLRLDRAPGWLHMAETLDRFGDSESTRSYRCFVESGIDDETSKFYSENRVAPVLGSQDFRKRIDRRAETELRRQDTEIPEARRVPIRPPIVEIAEAVCGAFSIRQSDLHLSTNRVKQCALARGAVALLGRELGGLPLSFIGPWLGYRSYAGASQAMLRLRVLMATDSRVQRQVESARDAVRVGRQD